MMTTTVTISYLGSLAPDGTTHGGWTDHRPATRVQPTQVSLPIALPVRVHVGWGDREDPSQLAVWTDTDDTSLMMEANERGIAAYHRPEPHGHRYDAAEPVWAPAFRSAVEAIRAAALAAEESRPEVRTVCDSYRAIRAQIRLAHDAHYAQWERDMVTIAAKFHRARVVVGEQTVPGLCVVRSTRGTTLGYAHVWDGKFTGRIERRR